MAVLRCAICGEPQGSKGALNLHLATVHHSDPTASLTPPWIPRGRGLPVWAGFALVAAVGALAAGGAYLVVRNPGGESASVTTSEPTTTTTSTTAPTTTSPPPTAAPTTTVPALRPGAACALGSDPDCIDPDGDGAGTYLIGGGQCMATFAPDSPGLCSDLDGDGYAGYPDSG